MNNFNTACDKICYYYQPHNNIKIRENNKK